MVEFMLDKKLSSCKQSISHLDLTCFKQFIVQVHIHAMKVKIAKIVWPTIPNKVFSKSQVNHSDRKSLQDIQIHIKLIVIWQPKIKSSKNLKMFSSLTNNELEYFLSLHLWYTRLLLMQYLSPGYIEHAWVCQNFIGVYRYVPGVWPSKSLTLFHI